MSIFLVGYDYGMGGVWGLVDAPSEVEIKRIYPEVKVVHERPIWMTDATYEEIIARGPCNVYGEPVGFLKVVVAERSKTAPNWRGKDLGR